MSTPEKKTDPPAGPHDHDKDTKHGAKAAKPYDGPDRRKSGIAERRITALDATFPPAKFPAWRYHESQGSKVVQTQAEADALGAGWSDTPAEAPEDAASRRFRPGQAKEF